MVAEASQREVGDEVADVEVRGPAGGVVEVDEADLVADDDLVLVEIAVDHGGARPRCGEDGRAAPDFLGDRIGRVRGALVEDRELLADGVRA